MNEISRDTDFTPKQLERIRKVGPLIALVRIAIALTFFSLAAGGPRNFFSEPTGQIFGLLFALFLAVEQYLQAPDVGRNKKDKGSFRVGKVLFLAVWLAAIADWYWLRPHWALLEWNWIWLVVGAGVAVMGMVVRIVAIRTLGRFFTRSVRLHREHKVIKEGIYARVRHPAYTGLLIISLGYITLFTSVLGYALFILLALPGIMHRIRVEEGVLAGEFGEEYREYCRKTKRLIPFIY